MTKNVRNNLLLVVAALCTSKLDKQFRDVLGREWNLSLVEWDKEYMEDSGSLTTVQRWSYSENCLTCFEQPCDVVGNQQLSYE